MTRSPLRGITEAVRRCIRFLPLLAPLLLAALVLVPPLAEATINNGENAIDILGQFNSWNSTPTYQGDTTADYVKGCVNNGASPLGFYENNSTVNENPGMALDATNHRLFVSDFMNNRVLVFNLNSSNQLSSKVAANVLGQSDFISCGINQGAGTTTPSQSSMYYPAGMDFDAGNNRLFVADGYNNRVLVFNTSSITNGMNASYVLGQANFIGNGQTTTQSSLVEPLDVKYDSVNSRLFVSDFGNNRIMVYTSTGTITNGENATYELGHASGGTAFTTATSGKTQLTLHSPNALAYDSADTLLYVSDFGNNRVMQFNVATGTIANGENAANVIGQANFTSSNAATPTQSGIAGPTGLSYDSTNNRLFASEYNNNRVTVFSTANVINGENATDVLGQYSTYSTDTTPDYTHGCIQNGPGPIGFNVPFTTAIDATNHWLFVADTDNNRVLVFTLNSSNQISSKTASYVLGQPDIKSCSTATTQSGLHTPIGLAVDSTNQFLYVSDYNNNRVMVFPTSSLSSGENASYVLGQSSFSSNSLSDGQAALTQPAGLALDSTNQLLYVADEANNRVMVFPAYGASGFASGENASYVLGQTGFGSNGTGITISTLSGPEGIAFDSANGRLFVVDEGNNRAMIFPAYGNASWAGNGENASYVLGQSTFSTNTGAVSQSGLWDPSGVAYDATNSRLFVTDQVRCGVMVFNVAPSYLSGGGGGNGENASYVLGPSSFSSSSCTSVTQSKMVLSAVQSYYPMSFPWYDSGNQLLYVPDEADNRIMQFNVATGTIANGENATDELGQYTSTSPTTDSWTTDNPDNGPTALGLDNPEDAVVDAVNHYLYVADKNNNRVLVYTLNSNNTLPTSSGGHTASYVLGQSSLQSANTAATTQSGMSEPTGLAIDTANQRLFVADENNNRVLVFNTASLSNGMNASSVLGQANYTSGNYNRTGTTTPAQNSLYNPTGLAYDSVSTTPRLFVGDLNNNRVMVFNVATGFTNGENASGELGQANYTTGTANRGSTVKQNNLNNPTGLAYDSTNTRLFVVDTDDNRVLAYSVATGFTNGENASNVLGQSSYTASTGNITQSGLDYPSGVAYDSVNARLFVADEEADRVLEFPAAPSVIANGENASLVVGQSNFTNNSSELTQSGMTMDSGTGGYYSLIWYDSGSQLLYTPDETYHRVMIFPTNNAGQVVNDEAAQYVLGQGSFTTGTANWSSGTTNQAGLAAPIGNLYDSTNGLEYVVDQENNRVMQFNVAPSTIANGENASDELGQYTTVAGATDSWTQNGPNNGPTALGMYFPMGIAIDPVHHYLFISDYDNNRVMVYTLNTDNSISTSGGGHTASYVLGQTSLQGGDAAATTISGLSNPLGLAIDTVNQRLFVADASNNRVLVFSTSGLSSGENASYVLGQTGFTSGNANQGGSAAQSTLSGPQDVTYDSVNSRLFVADTQNNRVLAFNVATGIIANGENASYVLGQTGFTGASANQGGSAGQNTLYFPYNLTYDAANSRLFVSDSNNARALVFNVAPAIIANGENAANVLGQSTFSGTSQNCTQAGMGVPGGLSYDANNNRLFYADDRWHQVLVFNAGPSVIANGENASFVLGQPNFTNCVGGLSQSLTSMTSGSANLTSGVLYDPGSGRVFITDTGNNRVMIFDGTTISTSSQWMFIPGYE